METGALVIGMTGRWTVTQAHLLRRAFARCAAQHPPYVIVDCARTPPSGVLPALLPALVVYRGARRPDTGVLVVAPTSVLETLLRRVPVTRLRHYPRLADALRDLKPHHVPDNVRRVHTRLAPTPEAAAAARRLLRESCRTWGIEDALDDGQLVISELVANAVEHARTDLDVTISHHRRKLRIAVADRSPAAPDLARRLSAARLDRGALSVRGRGLALVARSASGYGVIDGHGGKLVWATVTIPGERRGRLPDLKVIRQLRPSAWLRRVRVARRPAPARRPGPVYRPRPA
ncbi:ATP-binding protein [Micromonospora zhanjiangensis]|uniref:ATP-binding protein n=1 Tax=Micromonospora zhanjiangensis TaxID=1522057 RepID=A0ABV8KPP8_9ACTN